MMENAALVKGQKLNIMMIIYSISYIKYYQQFIPVIAFYYDTQSALFYFYLQKAKYERQILVLNGIVKVISATVNNEIVF